MKRSILFSFLGGLLFVTTNMAILAEDTVSINGREMSSEKFKSEVTEEVSREIEDLVLEYIEKEDDSEDGEYRHSKSRNKMPHPRKPASHIVGNTAEIYMVRPEEYKALRRGDLSMNTIIEGKNPMHLTVDEVLHIRAQSNRLVRLEDGPPVNVISGTPKHALERLPIMDPLQHVPMPQVQQAMPQPSQPEEYSQQFIYSEVPSVMPPQYGQMPPSYQQMPPTQQFGAPPPSYQQMPPAQQFGASSLPQHNQMSPQSGYQPQVMQYNQPPQMKTSYAIPQNSMSNTNFQDMGLGAGANYLY